MSTIANGLTVQIARAVKKTREELKMTLREVAAKSGVSPSMISDIERGSKSPTIHTLAMLALALGLPLARLIDDDASATPRIRVVRRSEVRSSKDSKIGARRDSFGPPIAGSKIEFLQYAMRPRTKAGPFRAHARGTIEHIHVAQGAIRVAIGDETVSLAAGDSCSCYADRSHWFDNSDSARKALIYIVIEAPR